MNRGFTTIELVASFSIAMVILTLLFNVVLIMKDDYNNIEQKTDLLIKKDNLSYNINEKLKEKKLTRIENCDISSCYLFMYSDSTSDKLIYDKNDNTISFNNYTFSGNDNIEIDDISIKEYYDKTQSNLYNGYLVINIPISYNNKDYSIKVLYYYNTDDLTIVL